MDRCDRIVGARFRLLRLLKSAQGIATWSALDLERSALASVKVVEEGAVPPGLRLRLAQESEALRAISHPCVTPPFAAGREGGALFQAAPWVAGMTLAERLERGPLTTAEALRVGRCLLGALSEVHHRGVVHGDIRPSNVVLDAGRAVLIDFGLARRALLPGPRPPASAARYLAPELLAGAHPDERTDLYAVGAILSACLDTTAGAEREGLPDDSPLSRPDGERGLRALLEVVQHLTQEAALARYQSAGGALADLEEVERQLVLGLAAPAFTVGLHDVRGALAEPAFVGRERELAALEARAERACRGEAALVSLEAESGMGKTRLLDELARRCDGTFRLFRGRGAVEVGADPFRLLSGVVSDVVTLARGEPAFASALCEELRDQREALCAVFPELTALFGPVVVRESGPETLGEPRALAAFASFLAALGTGEHPALVLLDDCQWASGVVLKLLRTFHDRCRGATRPCHVLVVVSFRSEEVPEGHSLRALAGAPTLALPPLDASEIARLLESMAGGLSLPGEAVNVGQQLSLGNPFMASAVLQGMVECGALVFEGGAFRAERVALREVQSSRAAAAFLLERMEKLPAHALRLLSVGAVLGREFSVELAAALSGQSSAEVLGARAEARRRHVVWVRDHGSRLVFVHDKVREVLLTRVSDEERRRLHLEAALRLEKTSPGRAFEIAYHFDAADAPHRALPYALSAGNEARSRHALDVAEQHYRIARRGASPEALPTRMRIAEGLGDILMLRGRYGEAAREFQEARRLAVGSVDGARLEGKLGELAFKSGDVAAAGQRIERALRILGRRVPRRSAAVLLLLGWEILVQALHSLLPRLFVGRRRLEGSETEFLAIHLHSRLAHVCWFGRGNAATLWAHLREMNLAERYPPTLALAQAYSEHAPALTMIPWTSRGIEYARRSHEIRRALGDAWGQGQSLHFLGVVLYAASRFEESIQSCSEAIRFLERTGDQWEVNTARWHIAYCRYRMGSLRAAVDEARRVFRAGAEIGDAQARGIGLAIWSKASSGRVPRELIRVEMGRVTADVHTGAELLQAEAVRLLRLGSAADAAAVLREARTRVDRAGLKQEYVAPVLPWLTTALRRQIEMTPPHAPAHREALLREGLPLARRAVRLARSYRNNLPHALREQGLLLAMAGRPDESRRRLDESLTWAERLGMREEIARSRLARARIGLLYRWAGAAEDVAAAERALQAMAVAVAPEPGSVGERRSASLLQRMGALARAGRRLASARTSEEVFTAARAAAAELLREEECHLLEASRAEVEPADDGERAAVRRMLSNGELTALGPMDEAGPGAPCERATLCAPVRVHGEIAACLCASRSRPGRAFGQVELRLIDLLVSLTGSALEGIEALRQVEESKASFIGVLSHEIRNPLAAVRAGVHVLGRSPPDSEEARRAHAILERQVQQLTRLTDDLLEVTRLSRKKIRLLRESLDLTELALHAADDQRLLFDHRGVTLEVDAGDDPIRVTADPARVRQVIANLLENAAKFTPAGGRATLSVRQAGDWALVTVRDTGMGIAPEILPRLFQPFVQAEETLARTSGGLGLGLATVRELLHLQGGDIGAFSDGLGKGATFVVRLPLLRGAPTSLAAQRASDREGSNRAGQGRPPEVPSAERTAIAPEVRQRG